MVSAQTPPTMIPPAPQNPEAVDAAAVPPEPTAATAAQADAPLAAWQDPAAEAAGPVPATPPSGPGELLVRAREALGWSAAEVARQLKLHPRQVQALEEETYERLPSPFYVRGFARSYARLVGADLPALMRMLDQRCPLPDRAPADALPEASIGSALPSADRPSRRYVRVAVGVLLAVASLAVVDRYWPLLPGSRAPALVPAVAVDPASLATPLPGTLAEPGAGAPGQDVPPGAAPGEPSVPATAAPAPQSTAAPARTVRLSFDRESWVEIRDAAGQVILSGLNRAGTERIVEGQAPLAVVVGNASGVRIDYRERRVDLQPYTQVNIARLTLD